MSPYKLGGGTVDPRVSQQPISFALCNAAISGVLQTEILPNMSRQEATSAPINRDNNDMCRKLLGFSLMIEADANHNSCALVNVMRIDLIRRKAQKAQKAQKAINPWRLQRGTYDRDSMGWKLDITRTPSTAPRALAPHSMNVLCRPIPWIILNAGKLMKADANDL